MQIKQQSTAGYANVTRPDTAATQTQTMKTDKTLISDLLLILVTLLAAAGWIFSKEALQGIAPLSFLGIRFLLAGLLLSLFCLPLLRSLTAAQWRQAIAIGGLFAVALMIWVLGLFHCTHIGEGAFITSLGVVMVPVFAALFFKESPGFSTWIALPVAIIGLACLSLNKSLSGDGFHFEMGQWLFVVAALIFAVQFNLISKVVANIPAFALTAIQLTSVGLVSLLVSFFFEDWPPSISNLTWGWILASVVIASAARFLVQTFAQSMASASHAAVILILEPIWTTVAAAFWFSETMNGLQMLGCSLIFLALLINRWRAVQQFIKSVLK